MAGRYDENKDWSQRGENRVSPELETIQEKKLNGLILMNGQTLWTLNDGYLNEWYWMKGMKDTEKDEMNTSQ